MILAENNTFSTVQKNTFRRYRSIALIVLCDMCGNFYGSKIQAWTGKF